jgi:prophage regulatory protein
MQTTNTDEPAARDASATTPERLIRLPAVLDRVGLGRTAVLDRVKAGTFPAPLKVGRATLWQESAVSAWCVAQVRAQRKG